MRSQACHFTVRSTRRRWGRRWNRECGTRRRLGRTSVGRGHGRGVGDRRRRVSQRGGDNHRLRGARSRDPDDDRVEPAIPAPAPTHCARSSVRARRLTVIRPRAARPRGASSWSGLSSGRYPSDRREKLSGRVTPVRPHRPRSASCAGWRPMAAREGRPGGRHDVRRSSSTARWRWSRSARRCSLAHEHGVARMTLWPKGPSAQHPIPHSPVSAAAEPFVTVAAREEAHGGQPADPLSLLRAWLPATRPRRQALLRSPRR